MDLPALVHVCRLTSGSVQMSRCHAIARLQGCFLPAAYLHGPLESEVGEGEQLVADIVIEGTTDHPQHIRRVLLVHGGRTRSTDTTGAFTCAK